ncbi:MAG: transglutaminase-like domain-containing protein [Paludibacter sp.]
MKQLKAIVSLLIIPFITVLPQVSKLYPNDVEPILQKAKNNRKELETFLNYCKETNDSLKWKAACFLVSNMDIHYSETYYWADSLNHKVEYNELGYPNYSYAIKAFDDLRKTKKIHPVISRVYDVDCIKSNFLIDNLNRAFKDWKSPQAKHLTFDEFCEYILPYRDITENLETWRPTYTDTFSIKDIQLRNNLSVRKATNLFNDKLRGYMVSSFGYENKNCPVSYLSPSQLLFRQRGHCEDLVNFTLLAFKSQGIPCRIDMTPYHATSTGRHYWNASIDENHTPIPFEGSQESVEEFLMKREPSKVITLTYGRQPEALASILSESEIPNNYLRKTNYRDVTDQYWRTAGIKCQLSQTLGKKVAYIAVFNGLRWQPAFWGKLENNNEVTFPKMSCGVVYLPMLYHEGKLIPAGNPVLLDNNKEIHPFVPDKTKLQNITMEEQEKYLNFRAGKKYRLFYWDMGWKPAGTLQATEQPRLIFENVPSGSLYLMIPEYSEGKERPFEITPNGQRVWW